MRLIAALATATAVYLAIAITLGVAPRLRLWPAPSLDSSGLRTWLQQAGTRASPARFVGGSAALGAVSFVVLLALTRVPAVAVVPSLAAAWVPRWWLARRRAARLRRLQEAWPDGIRDLVASTAAGLSLHQALLELVANGPPVLREAFARYPALSRVLGVVPALELLEEELADPASDRVIEVLILAHERGGPLLSRILRDLAEATTRDLRALDELASESLEQRLNARAVFVLPWLVLLVLTLRDGFFRDYYRSAAGVAVVLLGAALSLLGAWWVARLAREPEERRVLGSAATRELGGRS